MSSTNRAALSAILRAPQLGQKPRRGDVNGFTNAAGAGCAGIHVQAFRISGTLQIPA
jgi:hypothetical protein